MEMYTKVLLLVSCLPIVYCATAIEEAPVYSAKDRELGYACESGYEAIGLMKEGEVKKNFADDMCGQAYCSDGVIEYTGCGAEEEGPRCLVSGKDFSKPYPDCCGKVICYK
ncbi:hypothetical protein Trydic_g6967 [Trypoxylus dichotomus]